MRHTWAQVEEERLRKWYAAKKDAWNKAVVVYRTAKNALSKRKGRADEIRSDTLETLNLKFAEYAPCTTALPDSSFVLHLACMCSAAALLGPKDSFAAPPQIPGLAQLLRGHQD